MNHNELYKNIRSEALRFVTSNKGMKIDRGDPSALRYQSPRITSEFMDCSMPITFDDKNYCSLGCLYCFSAQFKTNNIASFNKLHAVDHQVIKRMVEGSPKTVREKSFHKHFFKKRFLFHWGGLADPFCNFEKANGTSYEIINILAQNAYPTLFSFKGSAMWRPNFQKLFSKYAKQKNFAFQVSIIAPSDEMSQKIEIGVPVTSRRIAAIKCLSEMGYYTILRLRPFIIGISDDGLGELLDRCKDAGINGVSMEFMAIDVRVNETLRKRFNWLGNQIGVKDIFEYYKKLSPKERQSYLRLNRLVKEPYVKQVYKFCIDNDLVFGCSDPDYKELNTSGSCCAMPDRYEPNKELQNWTKNQLTYHLKEARRLYHLKGKVSRLEFGRVYRPDQDTYLVSKQLGQDHVVCSDKIASEKSDINNLVIAREIWNNLRSPSNPRNYFNGKLTPCNYLDKDGNLVYKYVPSEYEDRWIKEGINLKK